MWISIARSKTHAHLDTCMQQQSGCGCGSGPRHLLKSIVGYGIVVANKLQHSHSYLEGGHDWSVSHCIVHLLCSSASPSAHSNQPMSSEIVTNICTTSALVKYLEILIGMFMLTLPS